MERRGMTYLVILGLALVTFVAYELSIINHNIAVIAKLLEELKK